MVVEPEMKYPILKLLLYKLFTYHRCYLTRNTSNFIYVQYLSFIYQEHEKFNAIFTQGGNICQGQSPREISLRVNVSSILPSGGYINYILYRNSIYTELKTFLCAANILITIG